MVEGDTAGGGRAETGRKTGRRLTVAEAAAEIGTTEEGIRSRIKRGTLRTEREKGRVFVILGPAQAPPHERPGPAQASAQAELVEALRGEVDHLRRELERRGAAEAELRRIIAALTQRIPELEAPAETPQEASGPPTEGAAPHPDTPIPPEAGTGGELRPWWRRMFGG